jgi:hypothetical protein
MHYLQNTSILYYQFTWEKQSGLSPQINMHNSVIRKKQFIGSVSETNLEKLISIAQPHEH